MLFVIFRQKANKLAHIYICKPTTFVKPHCMTRSARPPF
jgi:hypothetical protein